MIDRHALLTYSLEAADGRFPPVDGGCTIVSALPDGLECSVAFTGHAVIATTLPDDVVRSRKPDGFGGSVAPQFLCWLAGPAAGWCRRHLARSARSRRRVASGAH